MALSPVPETRVKGQLALVLGALGVVFGDIGTSPLYALREVFRESHGIPLDTTNVLGLLSLIFWTMTVIISLKYMLLVMRADNRGEGGIMALLALALRAQYRHPWMRPAIVLLGMFGAALFFGDGIITPAISVVSAVEGLEIAFPAMDRVVVPLSLCILLGLFWLQKRGTGSVGQLFGPIMVVWFAVLALLGIINIWKAPGILDLLDPGWAVTFMVSHPLASFLVLGAVILTITGAESIYADMGHFGRAAIQRAWFFMAFPALMLNYAGQGALLLTTPEAVSNPFFQMAPDWALLPLVGLATLAAVIASQAVITGVFSMTRQAMLLGYLPRLAIEHTSDSRQGQIYIPAVNWALWAAITLLVLMFQTSQALAALYGIAISMTMLCDTLLMWVVIYKVWGWRRRLASLLLVPILIIELVFFASTALKIVGGGWFPLIAGGVAFLLMLIWKRGRGALSRQLGEHTMPLNLFVNSIGGTADQTVPGTAIFMTANMDYVPHALLHNMKHNKIIHQRNVMLKVMIQDVPHLNDSERLRIQKVSHEFYLMTVSFGFKEQPDIPHALSLAEQQGLVFDMMDTSFFVSRERLVPTPNQGLNLRELLGFGLWQQKIFVALARNAAPATDFFLIPSNRVVEMGMQLKL